MGTHETAGGRPTRSTRRTFLTASAAATAATVAAPLAASPAAATDTVTPPGPGHPVRPQPPDRELTALLREIDRDRIEATVRRLAAFGTRHTLSDQNDPVRGIGAARDWIHAQLTGYAAASGGRMTVELQSYVQQPASRIPTATTITNVVATLRGDTAPDRVYVITGHYDSRATDVMDAVSDAPGADDDASGVAVVMELARVLASRRSEATIVLAAVAGEEQGLYGSAYLAGRLKAAGVDVQACSATTSSEAARPTTAPATRAPSGCSPRVCRRPRPRPRRACGSPSAGRTTRRRGSSPGSCPTWHATARRGWGSG
ncbi:M20/M25/M40 family metallo-hydrolase [Micromonospora chersina]|uniref:M20/M25/M40 family metallo-hydrolase n=1 Tax=Micromonospora chersina TaxID=47854 RepID=UPI0033DE17AC